MSTKRDEMVALRKRLMVGEPPYEIEPVMGRKVRKTGTKGLDELKDIGNYDAGADGTVLALETCLHIIDHILERLK
jgi:hypothetical protein